MNSNESRGTSSSRQLWMDPSQDKQSSKKNRRPRNRDQAKEPGGNSDGSRNAKLSSRTPGNEDKTPGVLLLKPQREPGTSSRPQSSGRRNPSSSQSDKPVPVILSRQDSSSTAIHNAPSKSFNSSPKMELKSLSTSQTNASQSLEDLIRRFVPSPSPSESSRPQVVKIVDEKFNFHSSENLQRKLGKQPGCFVIGVLGRRGAGKSTVLSSLTSDSDSFSNLFPRGSTSSKQNSKHERHETDGIDMYLSSEGVILLDTQPVLSMSILDKLDRIPPQYQSDRLRYMEILSAQLAVFMFAVCHVVVVVSDGPIDKGLWKFIRKVESIKTRLFQSSSDSASSSKMRKDTNLSEITETKKSLSFQPHLLYVGNDVGLSQFCPESYCKSMQSFADAFSTSIFQTESNLSLSRLAVPDLEEYIQDYLMKNSKEKARSFMATNYMLIPNQKQVKALFEASKRLLDSQDDKDISLADFDFPCTIKTLYKEFRHRVYQGLQKASAANQTNPVSARAFMISKEAWFQSAMRTWEGVNSIDIGELYEDAEN